MVYHLAVQVAKTQVHSASPVCNSQVIFALPGENGHDYAMRIYNSDGSEPEMCGNGIRCLAKFIADEDQAGNTSHRVHTLAGTTQPCLLSQTRLSQSLKYLLAPSGLSTVYLKLSMSLK